MTSPIERIAARTIGTISSVTPKQFSVLLDTNAPASTALNAGYPAPFPRINSYVLVPNEVGALVCLIAWMGIENAPFPKRTGLKDFGLVDLPFPLRRMTVLPLATLHAAGANDGLLKLERGIRVFPAVGDSVLLPTQEELRAIVEGRDENARVAIGTAPLAGAARISVDPDRLFGRHLAVLGNTGSGKSCSVAGLIRWSLQAAGEAGGGDEFRPNARFIILDPNGEYSTAFPDLPCQTRVFRVDPGEDEEVEALTVPAWMWNSEEWTAFSRAQPGTQRPLLLQALRGLRAGTSLEQPVTGRIRKFVFGHRLAFAQWLSGAASNMQFPDVIACGKRLETMKEDAEDLIQDTSVDSAIRTRVENLRDACDQIIANRSSESRGRVFYNFFSDGDLRRIIERLDDISAQLPAADTTLRDSADTPLPFDVRDLPQYLETVAGQEGGAGAQFIQFLTMRIRMMLGDERLARIVCPDENVGFEQWLSRHLGNDDEGCVAVLDLSLVPSDVLHLVISVLARIIFEALQRHRRAQKSTLPTVLVLEEAHTFVHRSRRNEEDTQGPEYMCRRTFERIAREGRKFGLGLVLASQRPSELSATVLAQCNTFLLHRIVNDHDQDLVRRLVPDNLGELLRELPALPTQYAILLGWATPVPVLIEMKELAEDHRPDSADAPYWATWCGDEERKADWESVAKEWQGRS